MFHDFRAVAAVALALAASAAPGASARPIRDPVPTTTRPAVEIVRVADHQAFDWGVAGIGAASGFAIAILGAGGALAMVELRNRRTDSPPASAPYRLAREPLAQARRAGPCPHRSVVLPKRRPWAAIAGPVPGESSAVTQGRWRTLPTPR
jgi:hypothetical protein